MAVPKDEKTMRILHYSLGIFPHRAGGLNRYATDLIKEQRKEHDVALLYPCGYRWWQKECYISKKKIQDGVTHYRLVNSLPIPLLHGIGNPEDFMGKPISLKSFEHCYNEFRPEVLHLHTLMGLPEAALFFFKEKGVRIVYTSHDYFGICPKVNLINEKGKMCEGPTQDRCTVCNASAPSTLYLRLRNCKLAFQLRDSFRWLRHTIHC